MRRTRTSFNCSGVGPVPPGPSGAVRISMRMPPPMPPRLAMSSHAVLPFSTDVRSMLGPPTMPPMAISSARCSLSGRTMVSDNVPSMSRPPIDRRNGPSALSPLRAATLSSPPSALRACDTMSATRSAACKGKGITRSTSMADANITTATVVNNRRMSVTPRQTAWGLTAHGLGLRA